MLALQASKVIDDKKLMERVQVINVISTSVSILQFLSLGDAICIFSFWGKGWAVGVFIFQHRYIVFNLTEILL